MSGKLRCITLFRNRLDSARHHVSRYPIHALQKFLNGRKSLLDKRKCQRQQLSAHSRIAYRPAVSVSEMTKRLYHYVIFVLHFFDSEVCHVAGLPLRKRMEVKGRQLQCFSSTCLRHTAAVCDFVVTDSQIAAEQIEALCTTYFMPSGFDFDASRMMCASVTPKIDADSCFLIYTLKPSERYLPCGISEFTSAFLLSFLIACGNFAACCLCLLRFATGNDSNDVLPISIRIQANEKKASREPSRPARSKLKSQNVAKNL